MFPHKFRTLKLQGSLHDKFKSEADPQYLTTLVNSIFGPYLVTYARIEQKFIYDQCDAILRKFYESKGHQKKNIHLGRYKSLIILIY